MLATAALFHDIGKIGMPDSILTKHEPLTREEQALMREHVTRGAEIVAKFPPFRGAIPAIRHHHERWDGLGYPDRLAAGRGKQLSPVVVDAFWEVAKRSPGDVLPSDEPTAAIAKIAV